MNIKSSFIMIGAGWTLVGETLTYILNKLKTSVFVCLFLFVCFNGLAIQSTVTYQQQ